MDKSGFVAAYTAKFRLRKKSGAPSAQHSETSFSAEAPASLDSSAPEETVMPEAVETENAPKVDRVAEIISAIRRKQGL